MKKRISFLFAVFLIVSSFLHVYANDPPEVVAESAVVMDLKSGQILYGKNEESLQYPASITKILTAIVAIEKGNLNDYVTVSEKAASVEGSSTYIEAGEQITLEQLIYGLLLQSGNDAATAIAEHVAGSVEDFADLMNETARKAGATHSHFMNPHGLDHEQHKVTAVDMALITEYAMHNPIFRRIFGTKEYAWKSKSWDTLLHNKHRLINGSIPSDGVTGGKTGFTQTAGQTLVTTASKDGMDIVVVVLKSVGTNVWRDTNKLIDYAFSNYATIQLGKRDGNIGNLAFDQSDRYRKWILAEDVYYTIKQSEQERLSEKYDKLQDAVEYKVEADPKAREGILQFFIDNSMIHEAKMVNLQKEVVIPEKVDKVTNKNSFKISGRGLLFLTLGAGVTVCGRSYIKKKRERRRRLKFRGRNNRFRF